MTYILLIMLSTVDTSTLTTVNFNTEMACLKALNEVLGLEKFSKGTIKARCLASGEK